MITLDDSEENVGIMTWLDNIARPIYRLSCFQRYTVSSSETAAINLFNDFVPLLRKTATFLKCTDTFKPTELV